MGGPGWGAHIRGSSHRINNGPFWTLTLFPSWERDRHTCCRPRHSIVNRQGHTHPGIHLPTRTQAHVPHPVLQVLHTWAHEEKGACAHRRAATGSSDEKDVDPCNGAAPASLGCVTFAVRLVEAESRMVVARSLREGHYLCKFYAQSMISGDLLYSIVLIAGTTQSNSQCFWGGRRC